MLNSIPQSKYITYSQIPVKTQQKPQNVKQETITPETFQYNPMLSKYMIKQTSRILPAAKTQAVSDSKNVQMVEWQNSLKDMLKNNEAVILGVIPRTMNAKDFDKTVLFKLVKFQVILSMQ